MDRVEFLEVMVTIIEKCLPEEALVFEAAGEAMMDDLWKYGALVSNKQVADAELVDAHTVKTVLECISLLNACYRLMRHAMLAVANKRAQRPSQEELYDLLVRSGAPPLIAQSAVENCRQELEKLVV